MPRLIEIPDSFYQEAAAAIAELRAINELNVRPLDIEKVLRSYVSLGVNKQILDWVFSLTEDQKDAIVRAVQAQTRNRYYFTPDYNRTATNFDIMETLAANGQVAPNIARPREYQERYEAQLVEAHAGDANPVTEGIKNFFGVVKSGADAVLKGLGINIPVELVLAVLVLLVILPYLRPAR